MVNVSSTSWKFWMSTYPDDHSVWTYNDIHTYYNVSHLLDSALSSGLLGLSPALRLPPWTEDRLPRRRRNDSRRDFLKDLRRDIALSPVPVRSGNKSNNNYTSTIPNDLSYCSSHTITLLPNTSKTNRILLSVDLKMHQNLLKNVW